MPRLFRKFGRTLAVLLIAVMVVVPVADAFACALEWDVGHATELALADDADAQGNDGQGETAHGVCAHNHCHHSTVGVPATAVVTEPPFDGSAQLSLVASGHLQDVTDGLMRPPRI